uniref:NEDD4 binding protein 2-like 2 n=1 Tax=Sander lucioperca TaxID=283035 RepID=A0A8C9YUW6_SANLU
MHDGRSPIIIDNTNTQAWEMKPYVKMALERGYKVDFCEPDTSWKFDPYELENATTNQSKASYTLEASRERFTASVRRTSHAHLEPRLRRVPARNRTDAYFSRETRNRKICL